MRRVSSLKVCCAPTVRSIFRSRGPEDARSEFQCLMWNLFCSAGGRACGVLVQMDEGRNDVFGTEYAFVTEHASWRGCSLFLTVME